MSFGLAISVYRIAVFDNSVAHIKEQNEEIRNRIALKQDEVEYYQSSQFKNKFAKEKLQRISPGEHVLVLLPAELVDDVLVETPQQSQKISREAEESLRLLPIIRHWQMYLFHQDEIESMLR
jgi:hypothetical protein